MNGDTLKTLTETILDGQTIDDVMFYQLLNVAKNIIEDNQPWMFLRKLQSSQTASQGNGYASAKLLPDDFRQAYKVMVGTGLGNEYLPVPFEEQIIYRNSSHRYYIDHAASSYYILGNVGQSDSIYFFYLKTTDDITEATAPTGWPARFCPILAYRVAAYFQAGVDADDIYARMSPVNRAAALELENVMKFWDMQLQNNSRNRQAQVQNSQPDFDLGLM